ncbi:hypothetical protein BJ912DRAFT_1033332 [Pholiota molesta]|nr:hypothetical protein BJ912DRAFT_1033332 [Pholiota molesta]
MEDDFAHGTTPVGALRGILGNYPYSVGLLREILQNSDDARASKQSFVLDRRTHATTELYHPDLASTQGPALLAFNDASFVADDWHALKFAYESSKADDSSKIGKYGVGFRSLFHITDCPQIVSGNTFAMFDPLMQFTGSAGKRLDLAHILRNNPGQLTSFTHFLNPQLPQSGFDGTIIRCPLRQTSSRISSKVIASDDIAHLFREFVFEEIDISLLFLQHIQQIDIYDINERGVSTCMAELSISRSPRSQYGPIAETYTATVNILIEGDSDERVWRIAQCAFDQAEAIRLLSKGFSDITTRILKEHKLLPTVGLAMPLTISPDDTATGRLFTFLPLPLPTRFPIHIHAYFALTQSRQNLRNSREIGLVPGSDDHVLVEWNKLLFDRYIPQGWKLLLEIMAEKDTISDIFLAWPPQQSPATSGENVYWEFLPKKMLDVSVSAKSSIWPVYQIGGMTASPTEFRPLDALVTADRTISDDVLKALTTVGLKLTRPPQYIVNLIKNSSRDNLRMLTPNEAHQCLLNHVDELHAADDNVNHTILTYLLSTKDVRNVIGLPLIRLPNKQKATLWTAGDTTLFILLTRAEFDVFGACDDNAIPLHSLPASVAETLRTYGPGMLNVENLAVPRIIEYLTVYPNRLGLDLSRTQTDPVARKWLSAFWIWQNTYPLKAELYANIRQLFLLPSSRGLRKADSPLFRSRGEHPVTVQHFASLGVPFLDPELSEPAQNILMQYGLSNSITDIHALLDSLPSSFDDLNLSGDACKAILGHIAHHISGSGSLRGPLGDQRTQRLRSLPIFPVAQYPKGAQILSTVWAALPSTCTVRNVQTPTFLPSIPDIIFLQLSSTTPPFIMNSIESAHPKHLSDVELLSLTVDHFVEQPDHVHAAALKYMAQNWRYIPPRITEALQRTSFVAVQAGSRKEPIEVVDPKSPIAPLYADNLERRIRNSTPSDDSIIRSMRSLKLMQDVLTVDIVRETIAAIASTSSSRKSLDLSKYLLSLMAKTSLNYAQLDLSPRQQWLPTDQGLRGFEECRDATTLSRHLFDKVLAVVDPTLTIPTSLKSALGWDRPLPIQILFSQLACTLDSPGDAFPVVFEIIKEIGSRTSTDEELIPLHDITRGRKWVPTIDRKLSETANAVFSQPLTESGFSQICHTDQPTRKFLRRMGCADRPSTAAILSKLQSARDQAPSLNVVNAALSLLRSLPSDLNEEDRSGLLVPDVNNILRPFSETFFNDIGDQVRLIPPDGSFISHPLLEDNLAQKLSLGRLGLKYADLAISGVEMGEKPVITVRKTLSQYTEKQFTTEFLANAADANATEFSLLINNFRGDQATEIHALSPVMAKFCTSPSLVVHNNATFADEDFTGICRTSVGGKQNKRETIGQFGLGALTMFHFTELAIVVSNNRVLFLNPSKAHLPIRDSAALLLPLDHVRKFYRSHLAPIDGLFGFNISDSFPYNGTIFLLPLREHSHLEASEYILRNIWTADDVEKDIVKSFSESASDSLLFTRMKRISGFIRDSDGHQRLTWSFDAERTLNSIDSLHGLSMTHIAITGHSTSVSTWKVASVTVPEADIPEDLHSLATELRLRLPPVAGLALLLEDSPQKPDKFKFFSTLPLAIRNSLPVHVMASFILASDRRQIRMDDDAGPETRYNRWLLTEIVPSLYFYVLEQMLQLGDDRDNESWWPWHRSNDDPYSRSIVDAFYSQKLMNSGRKLFRSSFYPVMSLLATEAVLSGEEPLKIKDVLADMRPYNMVELPKAVYRLATNPDRSDIAKVTPDFLRTEILQDSSSITQSNLETIKDVIVYLSSSIPSGTPSNLFGLPILPLEDGSFGTFSDTSDPTEYFVWAPKTIAARHNFPSQHFVHPQLRVPKLLKLGVNVMPLQPTGIRRFIEGTLPTSSPARGLASQTKAWISEFWNTWDEYFLLGLRSPDIFDFPLVPTIHPDIFVSLSQCQEGTALLVGGSKEGDELLRAALHRLGLIVVRLDEEPTPESLRPLLKSQGFPSLNFENVLSAISLIDALDEKFRDLERELLIAFASWARRNVQTIPDNLLPVALRLPIWRSVKNGMPEKHRPATDVSMLPDGLNIATAGRFMRVLVANYGGLKSLEKTALTFEEVADMLDLPDIMEVSDLRLYNAFLRAWIPHLPPSYTQPIPLPNSNRVMTPSNELYARTPLFLAIFGDDSDHFIARELAEVEHLFYKHRLRNDAQLDLPIFRICAEAISSRQDEEQIVRAGALFETYCVSLPMHVDADDEEVWRELDQISFIPRNTNAERRLDDQRENEAGIPIPLDIANLPNIVSPLNLVKREFEAVAWTQRALFLVQPHQRVLIAHPALGRPDISEVIRHLQALASLSATASRQQRRIILHDLIQTYTFLVDNASAENSQVIADQISNGSLFLNVDDPDTQGWHWDDRDHLVFETQDTEGSFRYVRNFLLPFEKLLRVAGVLEVYHPQYSSEHSTNSDTLKLEAIRKGFDALRQQNSLTDLVFITGPADSSESGSGDLPPLVAHRAFLAVVSEYFSDSFCGGFIESRAASPQDPIEFPVRENSRQCVQAILNYIYTGTQPMNNAPLDLLLEIMQLSGYWQMQKEIVGRRLMTPLTVDSIREMAEQSNAQNLLRNCADYEEINAAFILMVRQSAGADEDV